MEWKGTNFRFEQVKLNPASFRWSPRVCSLEHAGHLVVKKNWQLDERQKFARSSCCGFVARWLERLTGKRKCSVFYSVVAFVLVPGLVGLLRTHEQHMLSSYSCLFSLSFAPLSHLATASAIPIPASCVSVCVPRTSTIGRPRFDPRLGCAVFFSSDPAVSSHLLDTKKERNLIRCISSWLSELFAREARACAR